MAVSGSRRSDGSIGSSSQSARSSSHCCGMSLNLNDIPLYGRDSEIAALDDVFRNGGNQRTLITIHGKGGSGKSALIDSRREAWVMQQKEILFATGKFNENRSEPFSGVQEALRDLVNQLSATEIQDSQMLTPTKGLDNEVLCAAVSRMSINSKTPTNQTSRLRKRSSVRITQTQSNVSDGHFGCIRRATSRFLESICTQSRRVVLVLEDVQYADIVSLEFLNIMSGKEQGCEGLVLILSYRDEELGNDNPTNNTIAKFKDSTWSYYDLPVHDMNLEAVNSIVSKVTKTDRDECMSLSEVVYRKAGGNIFFVLQFLQLLEDEKYLQYSFDSFRWIWGDITTIERAMSVSDDVAEIVAHSMKRLQDETLQVLMLASCFGAEVPLIVLNEYVEGEDEDEVKAELDEWNVVALDRGESLNLQMDAKHMKTILDSCLKAGILGQRPFSHIYTWQHEKLQSAAYCMLDTRQRLGCHLRFGYLLCSMSLSLLSEDWMLFMAADQFNKAIALSPGTVRGFKIAELNLRAAKLSIEKSAFYPAVEMLRAAAQHLDEQGRWTDHYSLSLDVFCTLAETEFLLGNHDAAMIPATEVISNAKVREDKFRAQSIHLKVVTSGASRDYAKGVEMTLDILEEYDVKLPRKPNKLNMFQANRRLRSSLPKLKLNKLFELPSAPGSSENVVEKLLSDHLMEYAKVAPDGAHLAWIAAVEVLRLSCKNGVSDATAAALLGLALWLRRQEKFHESCENVQLADQLCDDFDTISNRRRYIIKACGNAGIIPNVRPFHECLEHLLLASKGSYSCGNTEMGSLAGFAYCMTYLAVGLPLAPVKSDLVSFGRDSRQFGVPFSIQALFLIFQQTILNLEGKSVHLTKLCGAAMDQDDVINKTNGQARAMTQRDLNTFRLLLSCIFRDYDTMEAMMEALASIQNTDLLYARIHTRMVFMGLASFALGRKRGSKKYIAQGKSILKHFREVAKKGSPNAPPIILMLEAEEAPSKERFDRAVTACGRSGLIHYEAYMCESAGLFFLDNKDEGWAEFYLRWATELYQDWGAHRKVLELKKDHGSLVTSSSHKRTSTSLKGRSRHQSDVRTSLVAFRRLSIGSQSG